MQSIHEDPVPSVYPMVISSPDILFSTNFTNFFSYFELFYSTLTASFWELVTQLRYAITDNVFKSSHAFILVFMKITWILHKFDLLLTKQSPPSLHLFCFFFFFWKPLWDEYSHNLHHGLISNTSVWTVVVSLRLTSIFDFPILRAKDKILWYFIQMRWWTGMVSNPCLYMTSLG